MIKKLSAFIFKDIGWKLLALLSAIVLYFIVMNVVNPLQRRSFTRNITYNGEDILKERGFIIMNKPASSVLLSIQAKQLDINNLYSPSAISAVVDLSVIDDSYNTRLGEPISLPINININIPSAYSVMSKNPESVSVIIDKIGSESRPIELNITGAVKDGYQNMPSLYQDTVNVTAPESVLSTIGKISADINIAGADKNVAVTDADLHVYDTDNHDITNSVTLSVSKIQVSIPVYPIKTITVIARTVGNPQNGYWVSEKAVSPKTVDIVGPADVLSGIDDMELAPIQLNGAIADLSENFNIWDYLKDTQLSIRSGSVSTVNVTVKIDKEATKHLSLLIGNINFIKDDSSLTPQIIPGDPIPITIQGPANAIGGITNSNLKAELDLTGLGTGIHNVPLHLDLPANVSILVGPKTLRVVINEENSTATVVPSSPADFGSPAPGSSSTTAGGSTTSSAATDSEPLSDTAEPGMPADTTVAGTSSDAAAFNASPDTTTSETLAETMAPETAAETIASEQPAADTDASASGGMAADESTSTDSTPDNS